MSKKLTLQWSVAVALDPTQNDVPCFVGRGTNVDPDGNLTDAGFSFDTMFSKEHPLSKKIEELEGTGKQIRLMIVPCKDEKDSLEKVIGLIKQYGRKGIDEKGTLLNLSNDGEGEGRTYSGSPSKMLH